MDLYQKVEKVIQEHILEHQEEVFNAKTLLRKLDVARCNHRSQDYSYDLDNVKHSSYYYDYDRNDPNRQIHLLKHQIIPNFNGIIKTNFRSY